MNISKDEFKKIIGDTLRKARKRKNISQEKAAEKIGVSRSVLARYENGTIDIPGSSIPELIYYYQSRMASLDIAVQEYSMNSEKLKNELYKYAAPLSEPEEMEIKKEEPQLTDEQKSAVDKLMPLMLYVFDAITESDMNESQKNLLINAIASNFVAVQEGCQTQSTLNHYIQKMLYFKMRHDVYRGKEVPDIEYKEYEH